MGRSTTRGTSRDGAFDARFWIERDEDALASTSVVAGADGAAIEIERRTVTARGVDASATPYALARGARGGGARALLVYMHGTGSSKEEVLDRARAYAREGWDCAVFDAVGHGERARGEDDAYGRVLAEAYDRIERSGETRERYGNSPYVVDGAIDCLRVARAALGNAPGTTRACFAGESLGGMYAACAAAGWSLDWGFKLVACAPMIGFSSFSYGVEHERWFARAISLPKRLWSRVSDGARETPTLADVKDFYSRVCPDICGGSRDGARVLARIRAKRVHFCAVNGSDDARNPMEGVMEAFAEQPSRAKQYGARAQCTIVAQKGVGHEITDVMRDVVRTFLTNVAANFVEPEAMTFDDKIWDVVSNEVAENVREPLRAKLESWANGGIDLASYLDDADREFLSNPASSVALASEGVDAVVALIEKARERAEVKYVSPFEIAKREKAERLVREREEAEEAERRRRVAEREAEREAERRRVEEAEARRLAAEAERVERARLQAEEAERRRVEAENAERARLEREELARERELEAEKKRAEEAAERARKEAEETRRVEGLARVRALLTKKNSVKEEMKASAKERVSDKLKVRQASISERLMRLKSSHSRRLQEEEDSERNGLI